MGIHIAVSSKKLQEWSEKRATAIWTNLLTNHLWQRMLKSILATAITATISLIPAVVRVYGTAAYLAPLATVFANPGQRFGQFTEALVLSVGGAILGVGWSILGIYLSSLLESTNEAAAYTVKAVFLVVAIFCHGLLRSHTPRLFLFVLLLIFVSVISLTGTAKSVSVSLVTMFMYPILTAAAVLVLINVLVFPEFSSNFLGITTIETLGETVGALRDAARYFVTISDETSKENEDSEAREELERWQTSRTTAEQPAEKKQDSENKLSMLQKFASFFIKPSKESSQSKPVDIAAPVKLKSLTDKKAKLRTKLASCKAAQQECNFELAWAVLPPGELKPINDSAMKKLVANTISLIAACESRYALLGDENHKSEEETENENTQAKSSEETKVGDGDTRPSMSAAPGPGTPDISHPDTPFDSELDDSADDTNRKIRQKKTKGRGKNRYKHKTNLEREKEDLELVKPQKEIEFGDAELLTYLVGNIRKPLASLQEAIDRSVDAVTSCLAYCYDVEKLPSGARPPTGIRLEEIDIRIGILTDALADFDRDSASSLERTSSLHEIDESQPDITPRMETFLISSFLLNLRQAAAHTLEMLKYSRVIVEKRHARHGRRRLYLPKINWSKWLVSGGEDDLIALPEGARKKARTGGDSDDAKDDDESLTSKESLLRENEVESGVKRDSRTQPSKSDTESKVPRKRTTKSGQEVTLTHQLRNGLADFLEYITGSEDVLYATKLTIAVFLVTFPAFVSNWNLWFYLNRGLWAALQLVMVTEVAIGLSVWAFVLRAVGTTLGCVWGYAAFQAGNGNRIICIVMLIIGMIPSTYIQLGSKYVKTGNVCIISMSIVVLATVDGTVSGTATETFLKRLIAFLIGGVIALIVEVILFPVRARDRLVESLAAAIRQISEMEACVAHGIESESNVSDIYSPIVSQRFDSAKAKSQAALTAAETFLPFCVREPRLKGSFQGLALIYAEILYVLRAIVDRMDNMLHLRYAYGSGVLEELNAQVYHYRRNVAGSITLNLFAAHAALTTKLPLPQFLPSARLAHLRLVNRVREIVLETGPGGMDIKGPVRSQIEMTLVKRIVKKKFLAWNAASAGQIEIIEYLEELIDLVKLLVGAHEFRSGLLTRSTYRELVDRFSRSSKQSGERDKDKDNREDVPRAGDPGNEARDIMPEPSKRPSGLVRRRTTVNSKAARDDTPEHQKQAEEDIPLSLQRVRSRRVAEMNLQNARSHDEESKRREENRIDKPTS